MTPNLLQYLCEPISKDALRLANAITDSDGQIQSGELIAQSGKKYPIINGIPRFVEFVPQETVSSFGNEWNHFNFIDFKVNWLSHTVANTFGSTEVFADKIIVDAGGGSGAQTKWFSEYGAKHVILMDLSHSVDDVVSRNLKGLSNVDVIQCSIDCPPLRDGCINGIVYCHNVIQHTPSVEKTAHALYAITAPGGEFVFNCYGLNDQGTLRWIRWHLIYLPMRAILSRMPFGLIMFYSRVVASLRLIPGLGKLLEISLLCTQGDIPKIAGESALQRLKRRFKAACLNTFDSYGSHQNQHHKSDDQILKLVQQLQPDMSKVSNMNNYFSRPPKIGCALRLQK